MASTRRSEERRVPAPEGLYNEDGGLDLLPGELDDLPDEDGKKPTPEEMAQEESPKKARGRELAARYADAAVDKATDDGSHRRPVLIEPVPPSAELQGPGDLPEKGQGYSLVKLIGEAPFRSIRELSERLLQVFVDDRNGLTYPEMLHIVRHEFPLSQTKANSLRWYQVRLREQGTPLPLRPVASPWRKQR